TIERVGGGGGAVTKIWNNPDTVYSKGWEFRIGWGIAQYDTTLAFTHIDIEDQYGNPVSVLRRKAASMGDRLVWDNRWQIRPNVAAGWTWTWVSNLEDAVSGEAGARAGYTVLDLQAAWRPAQYPDLRCAVMLRNVLDHRYSEHTSIAGDNGTLLEPGRELRFMVMYRF
uniref:TonB-dependent receptor domain-containing protein n=1 Tax=Desulfobulbus elongatus TaxID=53332 RepID=UPI0005519605